MTTHDDDDRLLDDVRHALARFAVGGLATLGDAGRILAERAQFLIVVQCSPLRGRLVAIAPDGSRREVYRAADAELPPGLGLTVGEFLEHGLNKLPERARTKLAARDEGATDLVLMQHPDGALGAYLVPRSGDFSTSVPLFLVEFPEPGPAGDAAHT